MRGDPQNWADTYHTVMSNIFNPLSSLLIRFSFIWRLISTNFVKTQKATDRLLSMMENLADEKRRQILNGEMENLADQEKDLLTMMIEADIEEGTKTTTTQLRVTYTLLATRCWFYSFPSAVYIAKYSLLPLCRP